MENDKLRINLLINNERYPLNIRRDEEQLYRDAAKQINDKLNKYRRTFPEFSDAKYLTMVALELAFENMSIKDKNDTQPYLEKLKELSDDLDSYIVEKNGNE